MLRVYRQPQSGQLIGAELAAPGVERRLALDGDGWYALATGMIGIGVESGPATTQTVEDSRINFAVEGSLFHNENVPRDQIDASTTDGIVTLKGITPNLLAKEKVVRQAQTVKGVRAVVDQIEAGLENHGCRSLERCDQRVDPRCIPLRSRRQTWVYSLIE